MVLSPSVNNREQDKFVEEPDGQTSVSVKVNNTALNPVPVIVSGSSTETVQTIYNITSPATPDTEFSQALSDGTKSFLLLVDGLAELKFSFEAGLTTFVTIPAGNTFYCDNLNLQSETLYMSCSGANQSIQILEVSV